MADGKREGKGKLGTHLHGLLPERVADDREERGRPLKYKLGVKERVRLCI
jgi:hypothetical protein